MMEYTKFVFKSDDKPLQSRIDIVLGDELYQALCELEEKRAIAYLKRDMEELLKSCSPRMK